MSLWGAFTNSVEAIQAQSNALGVISQNIANVNTVGYKSTTDEFQTVLSEQTAGSQMLGVQPIAQQNITQQGSLESTGVFDNLAINGSGFFVLNSELDGSGSAVYTRAGDFTEQAVSSSSSTTASLAGSLSSPATDTTSYLTDGQGNYLMGWAAVDGVADTSSGVSGLTAVGFDLGSTQNGQATTQVTLQGSLPAGSQDPVSASEPIYDNSFNTQSLDLTFTPDGSDTWTVTYSVDPSVGTVVQPTTPQTISFDGAGNFDGTTGSNTVNIDWADGTTSSINVDLTQMSQLASGSLVLNNTTQNGYASGTLEDVQFDSSGNLTGYYTNGQTQLLYTVPVATFSAPDQLNEISGTEFTQTANAGTLTVSPVSSLGSGTSLAPGNLESSNVDLNTQFTNLVTTQTAYNSATKVFSTANDMIETLRDLVT